MSFKGMRDAKMPRYPSWTFSILTFPQRFVGTSPIDDCGDEPIGYQLELVARPNTKHWLGKVAVLCELEMATEFPNAERFRPFPCFF